MAKMINRVFDLLLLDGKLITVGDEKSPEVDLRIPANGPRPLVPHKDFLYYTLKEFGAITVLDKSFKKVAEIPPGLNLYHRFEADEYMLLSCRKTVTFWQLYDANTMNDTGKAFRYRRKIGDHCYHYSKNFISCFSMLSDEPNWTVTYTESGSGVERDLEPFGNNDAVFVALTNGHLLALSTKDGSKLWELEDTETGGYVLHGDTIYKNKGLQLIEIDSRTGKAGRSVAYRDLLNDIENLRMTGDFKVYDDVALLKDTIRGHILAINRDSLQLQHHLSTGTHFRNESQFLHWHNNQIYVSDRDATLHIG